MAAPAPARSVSLTEFMDPDLFVHIAQELRAIYEHSFPNFNRGTGQVASDITVRALACARADMITVEQSQRAQQAAGRPTFVVFQLLSGECTFQGRVCRPTRAEVVELRTDITHVLSNVLALIPVDVYVERAIAARNFGPTANAFDVSLARSQERARAESVVANVPCYIPGEDTFKTLGKSFCMAMDSRGLDPTREPLLCTTHFMIGFTNFFLDARTIFRHFDEMLYLEATMTTEDLVAEGFDAARALGADGRNTRHGNFEGHLEFLRKALGDLRMTDFGSGASLPVIKPVRNYLANFVFRLVNSIEEPRLKRFLIARFHHLMSNWHNSFQGKKSSKRSKRKARCSK